MNSANKVALNTAILYGRLITTVGISLYATRLVLNALGATDFGIFNLVAGVIGMLAFLNYAMSAATQRFLSYHHGREDLNMQKKVFSNSLSLHVFLGLLVVGTLEIGSFFLFDGALNIPPDRVGTAKIIYQFMAVTVFFTIVSVPFTGTLNAYENMIWVAVVNALEACSKLAIAVFILNIQSDKLLMYGLLTAIVSILSFLMYMFYCFRKYEICTLKYMFPIDKKLAKEITFFAGWNLFGSLCTIARTQGLAVLLNIFYGAVINAAYGIANQVAAQLNFFSVTLLRAINPQIMKSEGANDRARMLRLTMMASKFGFFLLAFIAIPCIFEMRAILTIWLREVPQYTITFCQLILIGALFNQQTNTLFPAIQAVGKIKVYQIIVGSVLLLNIPLAYFLLKSHYPPYSILISYICIELVAGILRILNVKWATGLSVKSYIDRVLLKEIIPLGIIISTCFLLTNYMQWDYRFIITCGLSISLFFISIYLTGLCKDEKEMLDGMIKNVLNKIIKPNTSVKEKIQDQV